jgi:hypothetical protein
VPVGQPARPVKPVAATWCSWVEGDPVLGVASPGAEAQSVAWTLDDDRRGGWRRSSSAPQQILEAFSLLLCAEALQGPQTRFRQAVVGIPKRESVRLNLGVEPKQLEIGRNRGAGGAAEPGKFSMGIGFAGVEEGLVVKGLLERIPVLGDFESGSSRLTTDLDVRGVSSNSLKDQELIPDA